MARHRLRTTSPSTDARCGTRTAALRALPRSPRVATSWRAAGFAAVLLLHGAATAADAPGGTATLRIETNAPCTLQIAGHEPQQLTAGPARELSLPPGEIALACTSTTTPDAKATATRQLRIGASETVKLDVASVIVDKSCAGKPATFADLGQGVLRHCVTKADWTQADSAGDVDFAAAREQCAKRGEGWTLPKADELYAIVDRSGRSSTTCGRFTCNVSPRLTLTAPTFWSSEVPGKDLGMTVNLMLGSRHLALEHMKAGYRALCVRQPAS